MNGHAYGGVFMTLGAVVMHKAAVAQMVEQGTAPPRWPYGSAVRARSATNPFNNG